MSDSKGSRNTPFIGRESELRRLGELLEASHRGQGCLAVIGGEAGVGKTRLMGEFAKHARVRGCSILWSQMIEQPAAPPYLTWLLALRGYLQYADDETLREDLGSGASVLADILPELRDRLQLDVSQPPRDNEAARFQLFDAVARFLLALARRQPIVLLLDNLHLADLSSLRLLEYYAQQLVGSASLVIAAYRRGEQADGQLRQTLARLSGTAGLETFELAGLSQAEVAELLQATLGAPAPPALVSAIHSRGDGNPLFTTQVAADLARRGLAGEADADASFEIPASLGDVIATRLDAVPAKVLDVLRRAAVVGRDFDLPLLARLTGADVVTVADRVDEAASAGIVSARGFARFRFQHALFREVLYRQLSGGERCRLHEAAARSLESAGNDEPPVVDLAYHWFEAAQTGYRPQAVEWCRRAAADAMARRAYGEAAIQLERALKLAAMTESPDPELRFDLLSALGEAEYLAGQPALSDRAWLRAALLAHHHDWALRLADAVLAWQYVRASTGETHVASLPLHNAALELLPSDADAKRALLLASLALAYRHRDETERARATMAEGIELARRVAEPEVLFGCLIKGFYILYRAYDSPEQLPMMAEALAIARKAGLEENVLLGMAAYLFPLIKLGRIDEFRAQAEEFSDRADAANHHFFRQLASGFRAKLAILDGRWNEAVAVAQSSLRQASLEGLGGVEGRFAFQMFAVQRALGGLAAVAPLLERFAAAGESARSWLPGRILLHCELGQFDEARRALGKLGDLRRLVDDDLYETSLSFLAEGCALLGDRRRCRHLYEMLAPYRGFVLSLLGTVIHGPASACMARLAVALGRRKEARALFEEALELDAVMGSGPLLVRDRLGLADLLLRFDRPADERRARELVTAARNDAQRLGMQGALAVIERLAESGAAAPALTRREIAVLELIATGASNKQIADTLHLSPATVATHVRHILGKAAARNRTEAVAWARRHGVLSSG